MKAVRLHGRGGPDDLVYEDAPQPHAGAGEVLVRVYATGVIANELKWDVTYQTKAGNPRALPIPGRDLSGVVEEVGHGVTTLVPVQAAAVPLSALTAWQRLFEYAKLVAGQTVLIHGAAGGVGVFAVQLARHGGAHVIANASARNRDFLFELGATEVIDYTITRFEDVVQSVDVVFDLVGGDILQRSWQVVKPGGVLVSVVSPRPASDVANGHDARFAWFVVEPNREQLIQIGTLIDAGHIRPIVETALPLSEARRAYKQAAKGHTRGKIVLRVVN